MTPCLFRIALRFLNLYRKKKHFKIDARNHEYDRFYLINYLEVHHHVGKTIINR